MPAKEAAFDERIGAWVITDDGMEKLTKKLGNASLCRACAKGEPCDDGDFDEELKKHYTFREIDTDDDDDADEDEVTLLEKLIGKLSDGVEEFVRNLADEFPAAGSMRPDQVAAAAAVLGITLPATKEAIDEAFKKAAMKHHPDKGGNAEEMKRVLHARKVLQQAFG